MPTSFKEFCRLCKCLSREPSYNNKTTIIQSFIKENSKEGAFNGDLCLFAELLLPGTQKRVYNIKDKQILKLFSQIFQTDIQDMTKDLEDQGVVSDTIKTFFKDSPTLKPKEKSLLTLQEVDEYLKELSSFTKEEEQVSVLRKITRRCTATDLCYIVRLIKCDLRMNTGPKHFFDALDANAYALFQASSNIKSVINKWEQNQTQKLASTSGLKRTLSIHATLMTPVKPMLAEACKSIEQAFKKCPNGMFSEIKYDGERVQIHKDGNKFQYFSRSLKPVQPHKIAEIKDFIPKACPEGDSLILDGEVLLMDTHTNKPLPFGTLGIHKKSKFKDATVCYVIFDILQFNNESLLKRTIQERREILCKHVKEIPHRIIHSEMKKLTKPSELQLMLKKCFAENLEGLVVKDIKSYYEPGKRHWLKIKKDYLQEGAMADSADLVVLGAYYGTGNKGGMMSVFLMGCYDEKKDKWVTVAKCGNGHDDETLKKLQKQLDMIKINKEMSKVPTWLDVNRSLVPDFISSNPKKSQVWEISGAEFSQSTTHTADGISIRFPRVTKVRHDKDWKTATGLSQLKILFEESKKTTDVEMDASTEPASTSAESTTTTHHLPEDQSSSATKKEERKRKKKEQDDAEPKQKKKTCPYGRSCYRTSVEHLNEFSHIEGGDGGDGNLLQNKKKELENVFTDMKFILTKDIKNEKKLRRYIIAYDGDVLEDYEKHEATHIVSQSPIEDEDGLTVVQPEWVWACIKKKCIVPLTE